jgi:hypothetical protein
MNIKILTFVLVLSAVVAGSVLFAPKSVSAAIGTPVNQFTGFSITGAATTSSAFTPPADSILIASVFGSQNTTVPAAPTITDSIGLTWTEITDVTYDGGTNPRYREKIFWASVGASPSSMTVTGTVTGVPRMSLSVISITGSGTDFSNNMSSTSPVGDPSATLPSAPGANSAVIGWAIASNGANAFIQPTGFTELFDLTWPSNAGDTEFVYDLTSPTQTLSWTSTNLKTMGIAIEVKEPAATTPPNPRIIRLRGGVRLLGGTRLQ